MGVLVGKCVDMCATVGVVACVALHVLLHMCVAYVRPCVSVKR